MRLSTTEKERRRSKRFVMELPVTVKAQDGAEHKCATRDISAGGIFFYGDVKIAPGSPMQLVMRLPPEITGGESQWVCCHGQVVRVVEDSAGGQLGVAMQIERLIFSPQVTA